MAATVIGDSEEIRAYVALDAPGGFKVAAEDAMVGVPEGHDCRSLLSATAFGRAYGRKRLPRRELGRRRRLPQADGSAQDQRACDENQLDTTHVPPCGFAVSNHFT